MRTLHTITHEPIHSGSLLSSSARTRHVVTNLSLHEFDDCLTSTYPALETPSLSDCFSHLPELSVRLKRQLFPNAVRIAYSHTNYIKKFIRKIISTSTINDRQNFSLYVLSTIFALLRRNFTVMRIRVHKCPCTFILMSFLWVTKVTFSLSKLNELNFIRS